MNIQLLKEFKNESQVLCGELMLFSPFAKNEIKQEADGLYISIYEDLVIVNEPDGQKSLTLIFEALRHLSDLTTQIKEYLSIERRIEDSEKIFRYIQFLLDTINDSINILAHFGYGFEDKEGHVYSSDEWTKHHEQVLTKGLEMANLLDKQTFKSHPEIITYRKLQLAIAARLHTYKREFEELYASPDRLTRDNETNLPILEGPRHRLVLMKELGILQRLRDDYHSLNDVEFAKLVGLLLGFSSKAELETLRKEYSLILHNRKAKGKGGSPINKNSVEAVRTALISINVSPKKLPEFD